MDNSPIQARLRAFRRRVRQLLGLHGLCWLLAACVGVTMVSGLLDWLLDLSAGVRALLLLALAGTTLWILYRMLLVPLFSRMRDVELALRVEARFPGLNDALASAVEFAEEPADSDRSGSVALKRAVLAKVNRQVGTLDFDSVLDWASARRAALSAGGVLVIALGLVLASPGSARIALARLTNPFGRTAWPRQTHLGLLDPPDRLARGEQFNLNVQVVRGRVPEQAVVHYQFEGGEIASEPLSPRGDRQFAGGLEAVTRSFDFYVRAGDGITEPRHVEVVPPPEIQTLQLRLVYPDYLAQPPEDLPPETGKVRAVWGTQVHIQARCTKPLEIAELRIGPNQIVPATISEDGTELQACFRLEESASYWIALRDRQGFDNRQASRYELKVQEDQPPEVFIERPASDIEVTANADIPLRVNVKDDFGIHDVELHHHSGSAPDTTSDVSIWSGADRPRRQVVDHVWHLADLGLTPGSTVSYHVTARDTDDLRGPHEGKSRQLRLLVVTPEDLARRLDDRQALIYQELERIRSLQADSRLQVENLREQLAQNPELSKGDQARLQTAEMLQRQVQRRVTSPNEGLQSLINQIQQDIQNNHIADSSIVDQIASVASGVDRIVREDLPPIEQNLGKARKSAEQAAATPATTEALAEAQKHQDAAISTLDELIEQMGKWESYRGITRDVRELQEQQEQLAAMTQETGRDTIGKSRDSLSPEAQAQLSRLAARQEQAREQLLRIQRKMDQTAGRLAENDPLGAESLREAAESARQAGTSELMQKAAASVAQNQVGAAEAAQRQASEDLKQMLDTLENNRERDLAKIVEKLRQAESKLAELRDRQLEQLNRTNQAKSDKDAESRRRELERLARQEKELQQETARLAQQLRRLQAEKAGKTSASAAGRMGQAGQQMQQAQAEQAEAEQQKVLEELDEARRQVADARREAEAQLAMEQLARIADTLVSLHNRQVSLQEETGRLEQARQEKGNWTRPQLASLRAATESQQTIQADTDKAREVLTAAPVFALTLTRAMSNMDRAAQLLADRRADQETQTAQQSAADRIAQLLEAMKTEGQAGKEQEGGEGGGEGGGQEGGPPRDGIPPLAQIKMLRSLQLEINNRTRELDAVRARENKLSTSQQKELESLGEEQGILANLVRELLQPADGDENQ